MIEDEESDEEELIEIPVIESVEGEKKHKVKLNFTANQQKIKKACLFPSFTLIQQFADDLYIHEKQKSSLGRIINK